MKVGLVVPHIFMQRQILPNVIFSPGQLALSLAGNLIEQGAEVTVYSPGPVDTSAKNIHADLSLFEQELNYRGDSYLDLLRKHPFTFVTLGRQVQSELIAAAYEDANKSMLDLIHIYTNEEDTALPFSKFCKKPVVFTHHDPFNLLVRYRSVFPKYSELNWLSLSFAQRKSMPKSTNWIGNIYHGLEEDLFKPNYHPNGGYVVYLGRVIEAKGVHLAIEAVQRYNRKARAKLILKIAGKHYGSDYNDKYWLQKIQPNLDSGEVEYLGFLNDHDKKQELLGNAEALLMPSLFEEPFGLVMIEALACGTPIVGLNSGSIPEIINNQVNGYLIEKIIDPATKLTDEDFTAAAMAEQIANIASIDRRDCRDSFEQRFTAERMAQEHLKAYEKLF